MERARIYLVPGFFGFTSLGALNYFRGVAEHLGRALEARGVDADIVECRTLPTASIRSRAVALYRQVLGTGGLDAPALHFVGHSTGGLDVRLLVTPGVRLLPEGREEEIGARTRSVTTVSTPHFGTPLAGFFTTVEGGHLLRLLTIVASSTEGRYTLWAASQILALLARYDDAFGRRNTFLDALSKALLSRVHLGAGDPVWEFLREVAADQGAIIQLTQESMHLYNAAVTDRPGVRYGSVVTAAPPPFAHRLDEVLGVEKAASVLVYALLHTLAAREHRHYPYPSPAADLADRLEGRLPFPVTQATNDAVVPTLSQLYGELLDVVVADHLDVVGQFGGAFGDPLADWLPSGSHLTEGRFAEVWGHVADAIARASPERGATVHRLEPGRRRGSGKRR